MNQGIFNCAVIYEKIKEEGYTGGCTIDPVIATAVLDRLLHHAHIINIKGNSYRLKERLKTGLYGNPHVKA
ncbi:DNA replication protein DnaC [Carboxydothermus ferrireducens DSM 11255]|uniref:DNA replication protein DnaC n=1 Tax=Carboxydothermus ferrireducens DSM 11255 TaxID=1119529 RepID=A0ABX2R9H2_9THEO|nr:DNA replication protein DnaC [Carboxydothermus ferrireducens DSM 11255]